MMITLVLDGGRNRMVQVNGSDTVESLYNKASEILVLQRDEFELHWGASLLQEGRRLIYYEIRNGDSVVVAIRVHGGCHALRYL